MQTEVLNIRNKFIYYSSQPWKKKIICMNHIFKKTAIYIKHNNFPSHVRENLKNNAVKEKLCIFPLPSKYG